MRAEVIGWRNRPVGRRSHDGCAGGLAVRTVPLGDLFSAGSQPGLIFAGARLSPSMFRRCDARCSSMARLLPFPRTAMNWIQFSGTEFIRFVTDLGLGLEGRRCGAAQRGYQPLMVEAGIAHGV